MRRSAGCRSCAAWLTTPGTSTPGHRSPDPWSNWRVAPAPCQCSRRRCCCACPTGCSPGSSPWPTRSCRRRRTWATSPAATSWPTTRRWSSTRGRARSRRRYGPSRRSPTTSSCVVRGRSRQRPVGQRPSSTTVWAATTRRSTRRGAVRPIPPRWVCRRPRWSSSSGRRHTWAARGMRSPRRGASSRWRRRAAPTGHSGPRRSSLPWSATNVTRTGGTGKRSTGWSGAVRACSSPGRICCTASGSAVRADDPRHDGTSNSPTGC